jgi:hypothetical protein
VATPTEALCYVPARAAIIIPARAVGAPARRKSFAQNHLIASSAARRTIASQPAELLGLRRYP